MKRNLYRQQQGVTLIVGLVMLLLMTIVGLAAMRGSGLQENMAASMRESNLTFQSAESVLREGERLVDSTVLANEPECVAPSCILVNAGNVNQAPIYWNQTNWNSSGISSNYVPLQSYSVHRYILEQLPFVQNMDGAIDQGAAKLGGDYFRVSAMATGYSSNSWVVLQSVFMWPVITP